MKIFDINNGKNKNFTIDIAWMIEEEREAEYIKLWYLKKQSWNHLLFKNYPTIMTILSWIWFIYLIYLLSKI